MTIGGIDPLLDKRGPQGEIRSKLAPQLDLIEELGSYGCSLLKRCLHSSERTMADVVVLPVMLRQVLVMIDSVQLHLAHAATYAGSLPLRALCEAAWSLEWTLTRGRDRWARQYHVAYLRRNRQAALATQPGTPEHSALAGMIEKEALNFVPGKGKGEQIQNTLEACTRLLESAELKELNEAFDTYRSQRRLKHEPPWHAPRLHANEVNPQSIRQLATALNRETEYHVLYSTYSAAVHGSGLASHVSFDTGVLYIEPIRSAAQFRAVCELTATLAMRTYELVLSHYRPAEREAFRRTYIERWRDRFIGMPDIVVNPVHLEP